MDSSSYSPTVSLTLDAASPCTDPALPGTSICSGQEVCLHYVILELNSALLVISQIPPGEVGGPELDWTRTTTLILPLCSGTVSWFINVLFLGLVPDQFLGPKDWHPLHNEWMNEFYCIYIIMYFARGGSSWWTLEQSFYFALLLQKEYFIASHSMSINLLYWAWQIRFWFLKLCNPPN